MKIIKTLKLVLLIIFYTNNAQANTDYFKDGLLLFEQQELEKAKFKFEQEIVFNPKSEKAYLYLSKIFNFQKKRELEKKNLDTVILLNPKNEEAVYNLAELKLKDSDYNESKKLIEQLLLFCKNYCLKGKKLEVEINKSIKK